jgi:hypothetical protein
MGFTPLPRTGMTGMQVRFILDLKGVRLQGGGDGGANTLGSVHDGLSILIRPHSLRHSGPADIFPA